MRVVIWSVEVPPPPVTGFLEKLELAREGNPVTLNCTLPVNPPEGVTVTVKLVLLPRFTVALPGESVTVNVPTGFTTRVPEVVCKSPGLVPVMVNG